MEEDIDNEVDAYLREYSCMIDRKLSREEYNELLRLSMKILGIRTDVYDIHGNHFDVSSSHFEEVILGC